MNPRHTMHWLIAAALCLAVPAAASAVKYDYDRDVDFSNWTYVAWRPAAKPGASITGRRITRAIEAEFAAKGYVLVTEPARADFLIEYRAAAWQEASVEGVYQGPAFGRSVSVRRETVGALVLNVYARATGRLAWHGVVSDALAGDPEHADRKTAKAVNRLLKKFPSRGGGR